MLSFSVFNLRNSRILFSVFFVVLVAFWIVSLNRKKNLISLQSKYYKVVSDFNASVLAYEKEPNNEKQQLFLDVIEQSEKFLNNQTQYNHYPEFFLTAYNAGILAYKMKDYEKALQMFNKALETNLDDFPLYFFSKINVAYTYIQVADMAKGKSEYKTALTLFQKAENALKGTDLNKSYSLLSLRCYAILYELFSECYYLLGSQDSLDQASLYLKKSFSVYESIKLELKKDKSQISNDKDVFIAVVRLMQLSRKISSKKSMVNS